MEKPTHVKVYEILPSGDRVLRFRYVIDDMPSDSLDLVKAIPENHPWEVVDFDNSSIVWTNASGFMLENMVDKCWPPQADRPEGLERWWHAVDTLFDGPGGSKLSFLDKIEAEVVTEPLPPYSVRDTVTGDVMGWFDTGDIVSNEKDTYVIEKPDSCSYEAIRVRMIGRRVVLDQVRLTFEYAATLKKVGKAYRQ